MVVVGLVHVEEFLRKHHECRQELSALIAELQGSKFDSPKELSAKYPSAKILDGKVVVFKVRGNQFRLSATVAYKTGVFVINALETHKEYDRRRLR
jgi:mRNA interferase HigB